MNSTTLNAAITEGAEIQKDTGRQMMILALGRDYVAIDLELAFIAEKKGIPVIASIWIG